MLNYPICMSLYGWSVSVCRLSLCVVCECVWLVYFSGDVEGVGDIEALAAATEDCIFNEFKNTEVKYKNRVISRVANLKVSFHLSHL